MRLPPLDSKIAATALTLALALTACGGDADGDAGVDPPGDAGAGADSGASDAGRRMDAGASDDAGALEDAGSSLDAAAVDGGPGAADGGVCNQSAVRFEFLASGPLEEGTLCDDLFVCLADAGEAARVMAASSRFVCSSSPDMGCPAGTCFFPTPGVIDAAELAEICAVTRIVPTPDVACRVYGP